MIKSAVFYVFALLSTLAAILTVSLSNPVKSAISMIFCFFCVAMIFFTLDAHFVAIAQMLVYTGAMMILFLPAAMRLESPGGKASYNLLKPTNLINIFLCLSLLAAITITITGAFSNGPMFYFAGEPSATIKAIGETLFNKYIFAFEALCILILAAITGVTSFLEKESGKK